MEFEISLRIKVDPDANFLETFGNNCEGHTRFTYDKLV